MSLESEKDDIQEDIEELRTAIREGDEEKKRVLFEKVAKKLRDSNRDIYDELEKC